MYKKYVHVNHKLDWDEYEQELLVSEENPREQYGPNDKLATYGFIATELNKMLGKVLTLIDASIAESRQNKGIKDIIKQMFAEEYGFVSDMLLDQSVINASLSKAEEEGTLKTVSLDEALGLDDKKGH